MNVTEVEIDAKVTAHVNLAARIDEASENQATQAQHDPTPRATTGIVLADD